MLIMGERANCARELPQLKPTMVMNFTSCWENGRDDLSISYILQKKASQGGDTGQCSWKMKRERTSLLSTVLLLSRNRRITATDLHTDLRQITCVHVSALMIL